MLSLHVELSVHALDVRTKSNHVRPRAVWCRCVPQLELILLEEDSYLSSTGAEARPRAVDGSGLVDYRRVCNVVPRLQRAKYYSTTARNASDTTLSQRGLIVRFIIRYPPPPRRLWHQRLTREGFTQVWRSHDTFDPQNSPWSRNLYHSAWQRTDRRRESSVERTLDASLPGSKTTPSGNPLGRENLCVSYAREHNLPTSELSCAAHFSEGPWEQSESRVRDDGNKVKEFKEATAHKSSNRRTSNF
jgi:hypothetical protein